MSQFSWPADKVERRAVKDLVPYARNARTHSKAQIAQIAASIERWGWTMPILVDEAGGVIAGHGRLLAAETLSIETVPVMVAGGWSEAQKRAYVIADNQIALNAGWDLDLLADELRQLGAEGFDLSGVGFSADQLADLLNVQTAGLTDPDDVPETPAEPVTQPGDVYVLGRHRLVCGDSTKADDVARALDGARPHLMVTDPPYGVEYDADWRNHTGDETRSGRAVGKVLNDDKADWREAWALFTGDVAYVWHAGNMAHIVAESLIACGLALRAQIIWAKNQLVIGRGDYHPQHEPCWYAVRKGRKGHFRGDRKQTTLWTIDKPRKSETGHSTQKPVECMRRPILNNSAPGDAIYDPFLGSGTTLIACEMEGRICRGLELSPAYCDVIVKRWEEFTGQRANRIPAKEAAHV